MSGAEATDVTELERCGRAEGGTGEAMAGESGGSSGGGVRSQQT